MLANPRRSAIWRPALPRPGSMSSRPASRAAAEGAEADPRPAGYRARPQIVGIATDRSAPVALRRAAVSTWFDTPDQCRPWRREAGSLCGPLHRTRLMRLSRLSPARLWAGARSKCCIDVVVDRVPDAGPHADPGPAGRGRGSRAPNGALTAATAIEFEHGGDGLSRSACARWLSRDLAARRGRTRCAVIDARSDRPRRWLQRSCRWSGNAAAGIWKVDLP